MVRIYTTSQPKPALRELGEQFYVSRNTAKKYLQERGVFERLTKERRVEIGTVGATPRTWEEDQMDEIKYFYYTCNMTFKQIGKELGVPPSGIQDRFKKWNLKGRNPHETSRRGHITRKRNQESRAA